MSIRKNFTLVGHLGRDPEVETTKNGRTYCRFSICVNTRYKDKNTGETVKVSEWFYPVIWGKQAETFARLGGKGALVAVSGTPTANSVEDPQSGKKYQTPGFSVQNFEILKYADENSGGGGNHEVKKETKKAKKEVEEEIDYSLDGEESFEDALDFDSDDIPF